MATPNSLEKLLGGRTSGNMIRPPAPTPAVPAGSGAPLQPLSPLPSDNFTYNPLTRQVERLPRSVVELPTRPVGGGGGGIAPAITDTENQPITTPYSVDEILGIPRQRPRPPIIPVTPDASPNIAASGNRVLDAARAAVLGKIREQRQTGVRSYAPADAEAADAALRESLRRGGMNAPPTSAKPVSLRQRPDGGIIADYSDGTRVVTNRFGVGSSTPGPRTGVATIEGDPASQWFQEAANRQNRVVDMGIGNDLYIPEQRQAEFAEGTRRLKAAEAAAEAKAKARRV